MSMMIIVPSSMHYKKLCPISYFMVSFVCTFFGISQHIEIKKPQSAQPFAFLQFSNIDSVVKARKKLDGEYVGKNKVKVGSYSLVMGLPTPRQQNPAYKNIV